MAARTAWPVVGVPGWFVAEGWLDAVAYTTVGMVGFAILLLLLSRLRAIVGCLGLLWEAIEAPFRRG
jgi:Na+/proline symporter